ncbi:SgcJ/EcaC family oxidoreductase [Kibdelosporangium phytohabitans]|uniref:SnoaL-like domain-containing protein n=1 Tax=Kibdelosporangium phytohabitans TaxID=860235 RepID=A0A0N9I8R3_9PSEU|nr:SgcJ/EcaC family oxidoreductase [Kibdelosporangium phytohabitans]ALG11044.1 hypothetical protein AOZ06_32875 [Kibdelosporangium phytohabitans]MBE1462273.1 uncharacterized protein (TIGR02246 family) [Kibdelosporangium phytohabitans]
MTTKGLLAAMENAWNTGDGVAWAANFAADTVFVDALGGIHRGSATLRVEHQELFDTIYQGSTLKLHVVETRTLGTDLHLLRVGYTLHVPAGPRAGELRGMQMLLVQNGLILDFQNTFTRTDPDFAGIAGHPSQHFPAQGTASSPTR